MPDFLPRRDGEFAAFALHFANRLVESPARYEVAPERAASLLARAEAFAAAHRVTLFPESNTDLATQIKREARAAVEGELRPLASHLRALLSVSAADKTLLGLRERGKWHRTPAPSSRPIVRVRSVRGFSVSIALSDTEQMHHCRIPPDVRRAIVFCCTGKTPRPRLADWTMLITTSRARFTAELPTYEVAGAPVWVAACWSNHRGEMSALSTPVNVHGAAIAPSADRIGAATRAA